MINFSEEKTYIGIDPGFSGGIAVVNRSGLVDLIDMPVIKVGKKSHYDLRTMLATIRLYSSNSYLIIEESQPMPGQGVTSTFKTGVGYGIWLGIAGALDIPHRVIRPHVWVGEVLKGMPGQGKERSVLFVKQMYPHADLAPGKCTKPKDGRADAICIAHYGLMVGA